MSFLTEYQTHVNQRAAQGVVPLPLNAQQTSKLVELLKDPPTENQDVLVELFESRIPTGVDEAAYVKAAFLSDLIKGNTQSPLISPQKAVQLLGTMQGGYNIEPLLNTLENDELAPLAVKALSHTLLMFDSFYDVAKKAKQGNPYAQQILQSWANAEWFLSRPKLAEKLTYTVFKVSGETNTDDLSPAQDAWSRPDIPLHALAMLKNPREGIEPDEAGVIGPMKQIATLKQKGFPLVYVGDVVGTGSSRKSATNSVLWLMGEDMPYIPNKRTGGLVLGGKIAPIFFNTMEDAGALPIELDVSQLSMGDVIDIYPYTGKICKHNTDELLTTFELKTDVLLDEVRAGGRIPLIIGRGLTHKARIELGLPESDVFVKPQLSNENNKGFTLAQKIVGQACGVAGIRAGQYCEPRMTTVGSQDTTGPMTRDELKDLACLGFSADLVMQSFCHTAAYPKPVDVITHHSLPDFIMNRGGVSLRPSDGVIHSWLNRMLLPDTVGTGGDSHTRFPIGISFPAGSGLVAFAAATGVMPLDMPESVLIRFSGEIQPGITLRDLVHAIPYYAIQQGLLTVEKAGKKNIFSGKILEIEGLEHLKVEQAFEISDASAERSAAACCIKLNKEPIIEYLNSNIVLLKWMISEGYGDQTTLERRIKAMQDWLANPQLLEADKDAKYSTILEINLNEIKEPIVCAPNDPDDARLLSEVQGDKVDEVFIGSCMTNIGHFRAAGKLLNQHQGMLPTRLWVVPPTKMDAHLLSDEGYFSIYGKSGARIEIPGCSLCMGNQARVADGATVVSTSTRNFPNRMGKDAFVYLASAELSAICALLGRIPTPEEYLQYMQSLEADKDDTYRYMNFDQISSYSNKVDGLIFQTTV
ncbi:bifunctional aconitate hydratase 2/2-methylisocitrate dehydratase [Rodentibacter sp. Ppn85]|uniref:bifunctional aconitate hydratase 2/2-methylisocitrate dehydratase n=1 Tax=Rodentibacter sp. Ppn85 TaxID=1908525 RepID=UPI0009857374|nr:bifunctional aconitate hydratase 2/2-methylisocitrate dehydratase [Rodentibacter sp. Ppn85]OOF65852.1 bifunctional aconitate hydratase 2/2-methylisocitrate dehydratase [Rodentibacter sp. Ppn85]